MLYKKIRFEDKKSVLSSLMPLDSEFKGETPIISIDCEMVVCEDS